MENQNMTMSCYKDDSDEARKMRCCEW